MKYMMCALSGIILFLIGFADINAAQTKEKEMERSLETAERTTPGGGLNDAVIKYSLANGMTVLLEQNHSSPVVAVNVWVKVGSACEVEGEYGLAHVHEHMLFKGTDKRGVGEIAQIIEGNGGDINAFTSFDHTVYYVEIASRFLDTAIDVLSDVMGSSSFDSVELKKELEVVVEEIRRGEDSPSRKLNQRLFSEMFNSHPYGRPIIGTKESVRSFDRDKVLNFYNKWYSPNNMTLIIVGDFDVEELKPKLEKTFGALEARSKPECGVSKKAEQKGIKKFVFPNEISEGYFSLSFLTGGLRSEDTPALDIISNILGGGESSRLHRRIKEEKGLVNSIYSYSYTPKYDGLFVVSGTLESDKIEKIKDGFEEIIAEIYRLKYESVNPKELERAKINIESDSIYAKETMNGQANKLGYFEADVEDYRYENEYLKGIGSVTAEDIKQIASKYFVNDNLTIGFMHPNSEKTVDEKTLLDIAAKVSKSIDKEYASKVKEAPKATEYRFVLPNGIRVLVKENKAVPIFSARAVFLGGVRYEDDSTNGLSNFVAEMFTRGTSHRSSEEIAAEIESLAGDVGGFSGRNSIGATVEALSKNFDSAMDIFADIMLNPTFENEEIERARKEIVADINRLEDNLLRTAVNMFLDTLYTSHPYRFNPLGTKQNVSGFDRDDLKDFYDRLIRPGNMVISVVGDIEVESVVEKVKKLFGSMDGNDFKPIKLSAEPPLEKIRESALKKKDKEQSHVIIGFFAPPMSDPDHFALEVLNTVLSGQSGRLFIELRDKKSLAYTVTSFYTPGLETGYFGTYIGTSPHKESEAIEEMHNQLRRLLENGVTEAELERAKNNLVGNFEIGLQQNSSQAAKIAFDELYGLGWDDYKNFSDNILAVTADDIKRVAKKYIKMDKYVLTTVTPE